MEISDLGKTVHLLLRAFVILISGGCATAIGEDIPKEKIVGQVISLPASTKTLENSTFRTIFYWADIGWYGRPSLHWDNPSSFSIDSDGSWHFYAKRIANHRRVDGPIDGGSTYNYRADIQYYTIHDGVNNKCEGQLVHSGKYRFGAIAYKQIKYNTDAKGHDPVFASKWPTISCASMQLGFYR